MLKGVLVLLLLGVVRAADFSYAYGATGFFAWKASYGVDGAKAAYKSCYENTNDGSLTSTKAVCIFDLMRHIFGAASAVTVTGFGVAIPESGIGGAKEKESIDPETKRDKRFNLL